MGGHRRIATRLFLRYREHPTALAVLLSIDLDAARGRVLSARAYERLGGCSRRLVARLLEEYQAFRHELDPVQARTRRRRAPPAPSQRELRLLATVGRNRYHHERRHDDTTFHEVDRMSTDKACHEVHHDDTASEIQSEKEEERSRASKPEERGQARYRAVRAARVLLRREGVQFPTLEALEARAAELAPDVIEQALGA